LTDALNFFAPEARATIITAMETAIARGTPFDLELPFVTATGRRLWVRAQGQAERRDGQTVRVWGAFQDITERRLADENLRRSAERAEALARLGKYLGEVSTQYQAALPAVARLLAEVVGDGCALYLISADGQWLETAAIDHRDPGAAEALQALKAVAPSRADEGLSGRVLQSGQSLLIPQVDPAVLRASLPPEYDAYLARYSIHSLLCVALRAEGKPLGTLVMSRSTPDRAYTADDQSFLEVVAQRVALVIANARLYAGLEQRVRERTLSLQTEIAVRQRAEAEVRDLNLALAQQVTQLDATNRELETFSYSVSHDLRAPLRAIDGFSMILLEDYASQLDAAGRDYLGRVRAASQKMGELIDGMLALSRLTRAEMRREPVDLTAVARAALADLQAAEPQRQVELVVAEGLNTVGDPRLLRAVLDNLLGNAWKFTGKTEHARIEFGRLPPEAAPAAPGEPEQVFFVRDNGAGFDMSHADRLFGAFQRLHREADFAGSGIGLATVQRVLHRHGGRAWAEAQPGLGATFFFALPLAAA
jgi:signal transduction histidine kinase